MATLVVKLRGETVKELTLAPDQSYTAGRAETCDIFLNSETGISRQHIKIFFNGTTWVVTKLSRYGELIYRGADAAEVELADKTFFSVPPYDFEFINTSTQSVALVVMPESQKPLTPAPISTESAEDFEKTAIAQVTGATPYIKVLDKVGVPESTIQLDGDFWFGGRDDSSTVQLKDPRVSRKHFKLFRAGEVFYVQDLGSVNGTELNGVRISPDKPQPLNSGDTISVFEHQLVFELKDPNFEDKVKSLPLVPVESEDNFYDPRSTLPIHFNQAEVPGGVYMQDQYMAPYYSQLPGQHYNNTPPPLSPAAAPEKTLKLFGKDIPLTKENKIRIALLAIVFFAAIFYISEEDGSSTTSTQIALDDPFTKLKPDQQSFVKHTYRLAKNLYTQGNYQLAASEIAKIHELVPEYEDSMEIEARSKQSIELLREKALHEQALKDRQEQEEKIKAIAASCRKLITPAITIEQIETCLVPALEYNPDHPFIANVRTEANRVIEERRMKEAEEADYRERVAKMTDLYNFAESLKTQKPVEALSAFKKVVNTDLPDPKGFKGKAKRRIASIQSSIDKQIRVLIKESTALANEGKFKSAVLNLRKAYQLDPSNELARGESQRLTIELKKRMQALYHEAIVEENIGNVDVAKERWRRILQEDLEGEEYYNKSLIKLRKYGPI